jgi:hypothetical protein
MLSAMNALRWIEYLLQKWTQINFVIQYEGNNVEACDGALYILSTWLRTQTTYSKERIGFIKSPRWRPGAVMMSAATKKWFISILATRINHPFSDGSMIRVARAAQRRLYNYVFSEGRDQEDLLEMYIREFTAFVIDKKTQVHNDNVMAFGIAMMGAHITMQIEEAARENTPLPSITFNSRFESEKFANDPSRELREDPVAIFFPTNKRPRLQ